MYEAEHQRRVKQIQIERGTENFQNEYDRKVKQSAARRDEKLKVLDKMEAGYIKYAAVTQYTLEFFWHNVRLGLAEAEREKDRDGDLMSEVW